MIIRFDTQPKMSAIPAENRCFLCDDWFFRVDGRQIWIPAGYDYDGASIPRAFWWVVGSPFQPDLQAPALAHDWIYLTHLTDRSTADEALYQLMLQNLVSRWRARTIWGAVRTFGAIPWRNGLKDKAELRLLSQMLLPREDNKKFTI